ncbi:hypothetical protein MNBD_BACTEROID01-2263 [hydrothermal vent metagenome]|uniref:DUF2752 domain-containing protein n=1 Tax=hydrothermal vent metagenome TaxID=652676 RepID=A0A3B0U2F6_9ZZZZ
MLLISNSSKYIKSGLLVALIVLAAVFFFFLDPEEGVFFPKCVFHSLTGYYCPGCGSQRAIHSLLHLNISGVVNNNLLLIPAVLTMAYGLAIPEINRRFNKDYKNLLYYKQVPLVVLIIIVLFWILRNIRFYPFSVLAPG